MLDFWTVSRWHLFSNCHFTSLRAFFFSWENICPFLKYMSHKGMIGGTIRKIKIALYFHYSQDIDFFKRCSTISPYERVAPIHHLSWSEVYPFVSHARISLHPPFRKGLYRPTLENLELCRRSFTAIQRRTLWQCTVLWFWKSFWILNYISLFNRTLKKKYQLKRNKALRKFTIVMACCSSRSGWVAESRWAVGGGLAIWSIRAVRSRRAVGSWWGLAVWIGWAVHCRVLGHQSVDVCDYPYSRRLLPLMAPEVAVLAMLRFCLLFPTFAGHVSPSNVGAVLTPYLVADMGNNRQAPWTVFCSAVRSLRQTRPTHRTGHCRRRKFSNPGLAVPFQTLYVKHVRAGSPGYLST